MPKVVHIILGKANPNRLNGVNKVVYSLAQEAANVGHSVEVWGLTSDIETSVSLPFVLKLFILNPYQWGLNKSLHTAIAKEQPDTIFHLHGGLVFQFWLIAKQLMQQKRPYIITLHGNLLRQSIRRKFLLKRLYIAFFERFTLNNAYRVHCITVSEERDVLKWAAKAKIIVIPNGAILEPIHGTSQIHASIRFLYMGRFDVQHKGLDLLIKAFAIFRQSVKDARLFIAGDGSDKRYLERLIRKHHLHHSVRILPPHFNSDKVDLLQQCDVFVHASRWDVMPTSCLEAASHGKPLIVTHQTGLKPYIHKYHAGWVTTLAISNMAQTMHQAYQSWLKHALPNVGNAARRMIEIELQWPLVSQRFYAEIYDHAKS